MTNYSLIFCLVTLTACSGYSETFECEPGKGVGCTSLSSVNRLVETGALPVLDDSEKKEEERKISKKIKKEEKREDDSQPSRLRVWMAAYEDSVGYYHESAYVLGKSRHD